MTPAMQKKFRGLPDDRREEIKCKYAYKGDDTGFIAYVRQEGLGLEVMWLILDPMNPIDPRYVC